MPRFHNINGQNVQFTAAEETARDAEELAWANAADTRAAEANRETRNTLLAATDWRFRSDLVPSQAWKDYSTALRDIPSHANWPNLQEADWPTMPQGANMTITRKMADFAADVPSSIGSASQVLKVNSGANAYEWGDASASFNSLSDTTVNTGNPTLTTNPSAIGHMWINTTSGEGFICTDATANANIWGSLGLGDSPSIQPFGGSGGIKTTYGIYTVHTFLSSGNFVAEGATVSSAVDYLIIAGGGGGGSSYYSAGHGSSSGGGGGGAGGLITGQVSKAGGVTYPIVIGAGGGGGARNNYNGSPGIIGNNSSVFGLTAIGGGRGAADQNSASETGGNGGSGGGGSTSNSRAGGTATSGQGNNGGACGSNYTGAGGGGKGAVGGNSSSGNGGNGGVGLSNSLRTGSGVFYAGGGGGAIPSNTSGTGGNGGGGAGGVAGAGVAGTANTGGGGGGSSGVTGAAGGSGIVILRYVT